MNTQLYLYVYTYIYIYLYNIVCTRDKSSGYIRLVLLLLLLWNGRRCRKKQYIYIYVCVKKYKGSNIQEYYMSRGSLEGGHVMVRPSRVVETVAVVNEDIYDADPEFRYLALSLTVKNRLAGRVSRNVYGEQTRLSTLRKRRIREYEKRSR